MVKILGNLVIGSNFFSFINSVYNNLQLTLNLMVKDSLLSP